MARLRQLLSAPDVLSVFELGDSPFRETPYAGRVRHVSLLEENGLLHIVFSAIGDAPESILYTTMRMTGDWRQWKVGAIAEVLKPQTRYECPDLPVTKSEVGEIDHPAQQLRGPALFRTRASCISFTHSAGARHRWRRGHDHAIIAPP